MKVTFESKIADQTQTPLNVCKQYIHDMLGVPGNVSNRPTPDLIRLLIQRAHRSQNSRFPGFQFLAGYVRCHHALLLEPSETGLGCASPAWCGPLSGNPGVSRSPASGATRGAQAAPGKYVGIRPLDFLFIVLSVDVRD